MKTENRITSSLLASALVAIACQTSAKTNSVEALGGKAEQPVVVKKMLVLGNSISKHGPSKKLQWMGNWGMAASSEDKDYVHLLFAKLCAAQDAKPELIVSGAGGGTIAGHLADLSAITAHAADLVIIQLGENDRTVTADGFQKPYEKLIAAVKKANPAARVYGCGCWGKSPLKNMLVMNACRSQGAVFVDIEDVSGDPACSAGSEKRFTNAGVNWHPGDKGMQGYADAIWNAIRENPSMPPPQVGAEPQDAKEVTASAPPVEAGVIFAENFDGSGVVWRPAPSALEPGFSGNAAAIESADAKTAQSLQTVLPVERLQGRTITVTAKVKAANVSDKPANYNGIKVMLRLVDAEGEKDYPQAQIGVGSFDWKDVSLTRTIPENTVSAQLVLGLEKVSGKVWFDDVQVKDAAAVPGTAPTAVPAAAPTVAPTAAPGRRNDDSTRLRGFTTQEISVKNLEDMKIRWQANSVRLMMRPNAQSRWSKLPKYQDGWNALLKALPAYLDKARELDMAVILDLHEVPNENSKTYSQDRKAQKSDFWNDARNLDTMIECWRQLAAICQDRKQIIWFDILNEPLDWNDFPSFAKKWPDWAQKTVDAIRLVDKDQRPIVIEVGPGGLCWGFKDFPLLKGENIIYSTHNYQPHYYTHQGISDLNNTDLAQAFLKTNQPWPGVYGDTGGGMWDKARLYKELAPMIEFQKKHNVRIYISEFGVVRWAPNAEKYIRDSLEVYEEFGWDWSFHALHENAMWSPDYEPRYLESVLAKEPTPVGLVLQEYF